MMVPMKEEKLGFAEDDEDCINELRHLGKDEQHDP